MNSGNLELPPGFRFHPTDEELVMHYLCRKCSSMPISVPIIAEIDLYKFDPWQLPGLAEYGEKEWYFFSPRDRKYPNGSRPNRAAGSGYWKATGADKPIGTPKPVAIKKALVFYSGKAPKGIKTNWIMHEYRLADVDRSARKKNNSRLDDWVLCRIYNKKGTIEKVPNGEKRSVNRTFEDQKPINMAAPQPVPSQMMHDYHYFDVTDSIPRLHTDSSCSEHVVSPELKCEEVQSEPKWRDWDGELGMPSSFINDPYVQFSSNNEFSPLQDMFMYLQKPI